MFHSFTKTISHIVLPEKFTFPFCYTPHPLCIEAANELQEYIKSQILWAEELNRGKMFGVLVVRTDTGEIGYLASFSGTLAGSYNHPYFVPPIYDLLQPDGFFRIEEENISTINAKIEQIRDDVYYRECKDLLEKEKAYSFQLLNDAKVSLIEAKKTREIRRSVHPEETELREMIRESQFQKAEYKRLERYWKKRISDLHERVDAYEKEIERFKVERKRRSAALQKELFAQFKILNVRGEIKDLCTIFEEEVHKIPPAGAGECAAPKLLQYAYLNHLEPVAMAEFWWGDSPKTEIRRHGYFYPSCKGKCGPILKYMLQGLNVEPNPLSDACGVETELEIVYEDEYLLVINKPEGLLSVPGKNNADSVFRRMRERYPDATGPMIVHRLDMSTSGLLLIAKSKEVHQNLQAQFKRRTVKKRYIALLDGVILNDEGEINLPICLNPDDRPRQMVSWKYGKPAMTQYKVLERLQTRTRVTFYPITGRTHQLRVHAAHPQGLNCPIVGDRLYGRESDRLYLHAEYLEFEHPISSEIIRVEKSPSF